MIKLSQRDFRWADLRMPPSNLTLGRYGCTTFCLLMLADFFGCFVTPEKFIKENIKYTDHNYPAGAGLAIWGSLKLDNMKFVKRLHGFFPKEVDKSLVGSPKTAVILEVANRSHWVVAIRKVSFSKHYFIVDPWDGKVKTTAAYKNITGSAHFEAK